MKNSYFLLTCLLGLLIISAGCSNNTATQASHERPIPDDNIEKLRLAEKHKEVVRKWYEEGWNQKRNEELLYECFHQDWMDGHPFFPDQTNGLEGVRQKFTNYQNAFPDIHYTLTQLSADDQYVSVRYEVHGTHLGNIFNIPPTGKKVSSTGIVLYEMQDGKIKRNWGEADLLGLMNQLGNTPTNR